MSGTAPEGGWRRFHPLSPPLRGGLFLLAAVGYFLSQMADDLLTAATGGRPGAADGGPPGPDGFEASAASHPLLALAAFAVTLAGVVALGFASWWFSQYRLGPTSVEVRTGALFRQHREIRYSQIQSVNANQPLLARLFGLSEVRVEAAGGEDSHASLAYLGKAEADELRDRIVDLAERSGAPVEGALIEGPPIGVGPDPSPPQIPGEPQTNGHPATGAGDGRAAAATPPLVQMPFSRLVVGSVLSPGTLFVLLGGLVAAVVGVLVEPAAASAFVPVLFFGGINVVKRLTTWANLTVRLQGDTLRMRHGLTTLATSSVPVGKVQAIGIAQPWLWRGLGWWSISANVAGVKVGGEDVGSEGSLVPTATRDEVRAVVGALGPDVDLAPVLEVMDHGLPAAAIGCPRRARWFDPFAWRYQGVLLTPDLVVVRRGRLGRVVEVAPWRRVQSVAVSQGWLARGLRLADVRVISTQGAVQPLAQHLDARTAEAVAEEIRRRSSTARSASIDKGPAHGSCGSESDWVDLGGTQRDQPVVPTTERTHR